MNRVKVMLIRWLTETHMLAVEMHYRKAQREMIDNPTNRNSETRWLLIDAQRQLLLMMRDEL